MQAHRVRHGCSASVSRGWVLLCFVLCVVGVFVVLVSVPAIVRSFVGGIYCVCVFLYVFVFALGLGEAPSPTRRIALWGS